MNFEKKELILILNAVQSYKSAQQTQTTTRKSNGWDTTEQSDRIQDLDNIEEKIFSLLD